MEDDVNVVNGIVLIKLDDGGIRQVMVNSKMFIKILKYIAHNSPNGVIHISDKNITSLGEVVDYEKPVDVNNINMFDLYKNDEGVWMFNGVNFVLFSDDDKDPIVKSIEEIDINSLKKL